MRVTSIRQLFLLFCLIAMTAGGFAQAQPAKEYEPSVGQDGKDVVWFHRKRWWRKCSIWQKSAARLRHRSRLRRRPPVITAAAARQAHGWYNPDMVELWRNAAKEGVSDKATFKADLFDDSPRPSD
jgi:hypothetical protein